MKLHSLIIFAVFMLSACVTDESLKTDNNYLKRENSKLVSENNELRGMIRSNVDAYQKNLEQAWQSTIIQDNEYYLTNAIACGYVEKYLHINLCSDVVNRKAKELIAEGGQPVAWLSFVYILLGLVLLAVPFAVVVAIVVVVSEFIINSTRIRHQNAKILALDDKYREMIKVESEHLERVSELQNQIEQYRDEICEKEEMVQDLVLERIIHREYLSNIKDEIEKAELELEEIKKHKELMIF